MLILEIIYANTPTVIIKVIIINKTSCYDVPPAPISITVDAAQ